jgi:lipopolysaccharide transport system ATP-binding protein
MSDIAIRAEHLGKEYTIGGSKERYQTLRDSVMAFAKSPFRRFGAPSSRIWALKDVSFEIKQGEAVGIIGRNGAGKSTLLKVLSRITEPTEGRVALKGRVASLLEVGTGFHPELTGRENIYLNGAILGMTKAEIKGKFDQIVDFAEIEKFLDTPVKHFSTGMYVRLAFAVAAHLEPEILVVDEVLAVGDVQFQRRCLGKLNEVTHGGRTVLFVSHNMAAVQTLCTSVMLLRDGYAQAPSKDVKAVIRAHLFSRKEIKSEWVNGTRDEFKNPWFTPLRMSFANQAGQELQMPVGNDSEAWIHLESQVHENDPALAIGYAIYSEDEHLLFLSYHTDQSESKWPVLKKGVCKLRSKVPKRLLNQGKYRVEFIASLHARQWLLEPGKHCPAVYMSIEGGLSDSPYWIDRRPGLLAPELEWIGG